jgi:hypothetical protein
MHDVLRIRIEIADRRTCISMRRQCVHPCGVRSEHALLQLYTGRNDGLASDSEVPTARAAASVLLVKRACSLKIRVRLGPMSQYVALRWRTRRGAASEFS